MEISKKYFIWHAFTLALLGEIFDNFIANTRPFPIVFFIVVAYLLIFFGFSFFLEYLRERKKSIFLFCSIFGLFGLFIVEGLFLGNYTKPWPIQLYMFSYWFSIAAYPFLLKKNWKIILLPLAVAFLASIVIYFLTLNFGFAAGEFEFIFWLGSAIVNYFVLKKTYL